MDVHHRNIESPDNTDAPIVEGVGWSPTPKATKLWLADNKSYKAVVS